MGPVVSARGAAEKSECAVGLCALSHSTKHAPSHLYGVTSCSAPVARHVRSAGCVGHLPPQIAPALRASALLRKKCVPSCSCSFWPSRVVTKAPLEAARDALSRSRSIECRSMLTPSATTGSLARVASFAGCMKTHPRQRVIVSVSLTTSILPSTSVSSLTSSALVASGTASVGSCDDPSSGLPMRLLIYVCIVCSTAERGESAPADEAKPTSTSSDFWSPASLRIFCTLAQTSRAIASSSIGFVGLMLSTIRPAPSPIESVSHTSVAPAYSSETTMSSPEKVWPSSSIVPFAMYPASDSCPSPLMASCTFLYSLPKRLPRTVWLGRHLKRTSSGTSATRATETARTLSSSAMYDCSRFTASSAAGFWCTSVTSGSGVRSERLA
mmetsp:Transcript_53427/g.138154  ORF Transcript_53427/g.138154 Transcript_53427/m.138154 type:complete len:384 (+) Transcript_53427:165-1316(+)